MDYDTYHDGAVQEITFAHLAYCKIAGFYNRTKYRLNDWWRYTVLKKERPLPTPMQVLAQKIMAQSIEMLANEIQYTNYKFQNIRQGETIEIKKPVRFQAVKYSDDSIASQGEK